MMLKMVLCGDGGVGKTALRYRYLGKGFKAQYMMTIGADFAIKEIQLRTDVLYKQRSIQYQIWDLAGQPLFAHVRPLYYQGSHGVCLVYDVTRRGTYDNIINWVTELKKNSTKGIIPIVLLSNKIDLRIANDISVTREEGKGLAEQLSNTYFSGTRIVPYIETSAKTGENVELAFVNLAEEIIKFFNR